MVAEVDIIPDIDFSDAIKSQAVSSVNHVDSAIMSKQGALINTDVAPDFHISGVGDSCAGADVTMIANRVKPTVAF